MYLLDTNIWLERLLEQERAEEVGQLLERLSSDELLITDFSFEHEDSPQNPQNPDSESKIG